MSRDPLEEKGGLNLYVFVLNDPINGTDYLGLRELFSSEKSALMYYFGISLDVDVIDLRVTMFENQPWSPHGNKISLPEWFFLQNSECNELDLKNITVYSVFVHEAFHVWQRQHGSWVTPKALFPQIIEKIDTWLKINKYDPYRYDKSETDQMKLFKIFSEATVEQQAAIVEDYARDNLSGSDVSKYMKIADFIYEPMTIYNVDTWFEE